jgi:Fe-S cluster assembly protein SufB
MSTVTKTQTKSTHKRLVRPSPIVETPQGELKARYGISRKVVTELSAIKNEPAWMRQKRLDAFAIFERKPIPQWGVDLSELNFDDLVLYSPPTTGRFDSWADVPAEMKATYESLGVPQAEREMLAGVVGVWRQEPVYENLKAEYAAMGILFCSIETAIRDYPELVQEYFMKRCVPPQDNKFSALHGAVFSGGAFVFIPPGVNCDLPLQSYFRMEGAGEGTFEHTLIIASEGSSVNFIEGCTAQTYSVNSMHSAVVEIFVGEYAKARYSTIQNWSKDVINLNTKRALVSAHGTVEWIGGSMGAKKVMLYPGSYLIGEGARADHLNVGVASGKGVWKDTGARIIHQAPNTSSNILAKSISKDGGIMGYRGLVRMGKNSQGSKSRVQCDGLMMDGISRSDTWPDIQIQNPNVTVAHEATVGRISAEQLFYMGSRGFTEDEAAAMIVNGFVEPVTKELPMEYAVELNRLIQTEMVGSIG